MLKPENEVDKKRFEKVKESEERCDCDEDSAIENAAVDVKGMRKREGRSKEGDSPFPL